MNNRTVQVMFKRSRQKNLSIFLFNQDYYELPKLPTRANENIYHILKPNNFRGVQNVYQDKTSIDMVPNGFNLITSTCWTDKCLPLTTDMTKEKNNRRYRLGLSSLFVPDTNPFYTG